MPSRDFDSTFGVIKRTVKMHLLEDHMVEWISTHQAGCGLMGEQGAESIHAKFNSLIRTYSGIRNSTAKLKSIMNEHYLNVSPHISAAVPPPCTTCEKNEAKLTPIHLIQDTFCCIQDKAVDYIMSIE